MTQASNLSSGGSNFNSSGVLLAAGGGTGTTTFPAPGANGNALISNGTVWTSTAISTKPFVTGTAMLFQQTAAPTGWTKVTTYNDYALRIVSGAASTGGSVAFTTAFTSQAVNGSVGTSGATTLSTAQIPSHTHTNGIYRNDGGSTNLSIGNNPDAGTALSTGSAGSGGSHTHSGGTFTGTAINLTVQYVDCIIATIN